MCDINGCLGGMSLGGLLLSIGIAALGLLLLGFLLANLIGLVTLIRRFRFNPAGAFSPKPPKPPKRPDAAKKQDIWLPLLVLIIGVSVISALVALTVALVNGSGP